MLYPFFRSIPKDYNRTITCHFKLVLSRFHTPVSLASFQISIAYLTFTFLPTRGYFLLSSFFFFVQATSALLLALPSDKERAPFTPLVMPILAALSNTLSTQHELEAQEVLTALVEVAQNAVDFFRTSLVSLEYKHIKKYIYLYIV